MDSVMKEVVCRHSSSSGWCSMTPTCNPNFILSSAISSISLAISFILFPMLRRAKIFIGWKRVIRLLSPCAFKVIEHSSNISSST
ncbi:hypothetical protein MtrunA17_Chr6g0468391 [Medicago truncatula]|uniref:Transmembrane protein n=1 Tax=Medicago truncatula TaxID=3880 RepID=A0A396HFR5_MEDTR|nr:hypothetical protein MtrunA17_Chr6g0468391 [Medicago truncatula]